MVRGPIELRATGPVKMLYNVSQLLMEPIGSVRRFQLDDFIDVPLPAQKGSGGGADAREAAPTGWATGTVRLLRTHQGLLVNVFVEVQVEATCARCLTTCDRISTLDVEEECYPTIDPATGRYMRPPDESEGVVHIDTRQMLDLTDVLSQYLLTEEPLKVLCRRDCKGLCPECGTDLNSEKCKCESLAIDPRWGALAGLMSENRDG